VDPHQPVDPLLQRARQRVVGGVLVGIERVASDGRDVDAVEQGGGRGRRQEAPVGVEDVGEQRRRLVGFAGEGDDVGLPGIGRK